MAGLRRDDVSYAEAQRQERAEYEILSLMTPDTRKFAIQVGYPLDEDEQNALERLMLRDWIRLIDIGPVAAHPGVMRIFRVMPEAVNWYMANAARYAEAQ
jgi:hypothetical protein